MAWVAIGIGKKANSIVLEGYTRAIQEQDALPNMIDVLSRSLVGDLVFLEIDKS